MREIKQIHIIRTKLINKLEGVINEALANLPNSEFIETFDRGGGTIWAVIQYEKN